MLETPSSAASGPDLPVPAAGDARAEAAVWAVAALALVLWVAVTLPAALGHTTFCFRDLAELFIPLKAYGAAELRAGRIPATNPGWGLGQPFRGDSNAAAFYPGNVLYLLLPFWSAFNLDLTLHWLLAALAMGGLARALGTSRAAALLAALAWGGSGWLLAMVASIRSVTVLAAWIPLAALGLARGGRRGVAVAGLALGMAILNAEPVLVFGGLFVLAVALHAQGARRGLAAFAVACAAGALVGLPQLVATARVAPWTFRFGHGLLRSQATTFLFHPARLLELALPFPFGFAARPGVLAAWNHAVLPRVPLYPSVHAGVIALLLALVGARRWRLLAAVGVTGLLLACAGQVAVGPLQALFAGAFRSPEKLVVLAALTLPLLAARGLDAVLTGNSAWAVRGAALGAALAALTAALLAARGTLPPAARHALLQQLLVAALLLALGAFALQRRSAGLLLLLQLLGVVQLAPLLVQRPVAALRPALAFPPGLAVLPVEQTYPPWEPARTAPATGSAGWQAEAEAHELGPTPGVLAGHTYPAAGDLDGLSHRFYTLLLFRMSQAPWPQRIAWARLLGAQVASAREPILSPDARPLAVVRDAAGPLGFYAIERPAPAAWWPERLVVAPSPRAAFDLLDLGEPTRVAIVPAPLPHRPGAQVRVLPGDSPDRLAIEVEGEGGLLVVRRSFQVLWRAEAGGHELPVLPVDLALLGVAVPPGAQRVELTIRSWPETAAAAVALAAAAALAALALGAPLSRPAARTPAG